MTLGIPAQHVTQHLNVSPHFEKPPEIRFVKVVLVSSNKVKHVYFWDAEEHLGIYFLSHTYKLHLIHVFKMGLDRHLIRRSHSSSHQKP